MSSSSSDDKFVKSRRIFFSTPIAGCSHQSGAPSVSEIATSSSSNVAKTKRRRRRHKFRKPFRKAATEKAKNVKDSSSEWETRSERTVRIGRSSGLVRNSSILIQHDGRSTELPHAFESPEKIREAQVFVSPVNLFESPVLRPTRKPLRLGKSWDDFDQVEQVLPVQNIEPTIQRELDIQDESRSDAEDSLRIRRSSNPRTYSASRKKIPQRANTLPSGCRFFKNPHRYLYTRILSRGRVCTMRYIGSPKKLQKGRQRKKKKKPETTECYYGYSHKGSDEWIRNHDLYKFPEKEDESFNNGGEYGGRITFDEFRRRCRAKAKKALREASKGCIRDTE